MAITNKYIIIILLAISCTNGHKREKFLCGKEFEWDLIRNVISHQDDSTNVLVSSFAINLFLSFLYNTHNSLENTQISNELFKVVKDCVIIPSITKNTIEKKYEKALRELDKQCENYNCILNIDNTIFIKENELHTIENLKYKKFNISFLYYNKKWENYYLNKIIAMNRIDFHARWKYEFYSYFEERFLTYDGDSIDVDYLIVRKEFDTAFIPELNAQIVLLPYNTKALSMALILPNDDIDGIDDVINKLNWKTWSKSIDIRRLKKEKLEIILPKFQIFGKVDLKTILKLSGFHKIFNTDWKLFRNDSDTILNLSTIIQNLLLNVDQIGTEALPAKRLILSFNEEFGSYRRIKFNRPFLFFIIVRDLFVENRIILSGLMRDPSVKSISSD